MWLRGLAAAWIIFGLSFYHTQFVGPNELSLVLTVWALLFVVGGCLAGILSFHTKWKHLYEWTAGIVSAAPFARALYVILWDTGLAFTSQVIAATAWAFLGVTLALRWKDLVPVPVTIQVVSTEGQE